MKNKIKRFIPLLCCVALIFALIVPVSAADAESVTVEPNAVTAYSTTIYLDGQMFTFFGDATASPSVAMSITSSGALLSSGSQSYTFTYSGDGDFLGFAYTDTATSPTFEVDAKVNFPGSSGGNCSYTLYSVSKEDGGTSTDPVQYDPEGAWLFDPHLDSPPFDYLELQFNCVLDDQETSFVAFVYDPVSFVFSYELENGNFVSVWTRQDGWLDDDYRSVDITVFDGYIVDVELWTWFQNNAVQLFNYESGEFCSTTILIGDTPWMFTAPGSSPDVVITVNSSGCVLRSGLRSKIIRFSGVGSVLGFSHSPDAVIPDYAIDSSSTLPGGSDETIYELYLVTDSHIGISKTIKGGVWQVRRDDSGNFIPPSSSSAFISDFYFKSSGRSFVGLYCRFDGSVCYSDIDPSGANDVLVYDSSTSSWTEDYTAIYLTSDIPVSDDFYDWFTSTYYYASFDEDQTSFFAHVKIYNYSGSELLVSRYVFFENLSDLPRFSVASNGVFVVADGAIAFDWEVDDDVVFYGVSDCPFSPVTVWPVGSNFTFDSDGNFEVSLYISNVYYNDPADVELVGFLTSSVGGFLKFELWPGMSLQDLLWFVIVIGLLFAFLKITT